MIYFIIGLLAGFIVSFIYFATTKLAEPISKVERAVLYMNFTYNLNLTNNEIKEIIKRAILNEKGE